MPVFLPAAVLRQVCIHISVHICRYISTKGVTGPRIFTKIALSSTIELSSLASV